MLASLLLLLVQRPAAAPRPPVPADTTAGRPCEVAIDTLPRYYQRGADYFGGGGVRAHCKGTATTIASDSMAYLRSAGRLDLIGQVHIRDTTIALDANLASYFTAAERLEAHNHVVAVNRDNHSTLRGPNLTYWRVVKGIRDTVEMFASGRPTIEYHGSADSTEPYLIVADRVRFKGNDRMWGGGKVTIDRSDLASRADSMNLDQTKGLGVLVGHPSMAGKDSAGTTAYTLVGTRIELGLAGREIDLVKALGAGRASGSDWTLTADTIHLRVARRKLQQAFAWGRTQRPHAVSTRQTFDADSLALDAPDQVLTELRGFGRSVSTTQRDSTARRRRRDWTGRDSSLARLVEGPDYITGDTLLAHWFQASEGGRRVSQLRNILARGSAHALTHVEPKDTATEASLDYSRGASIAIALKAGRVDRVVVGGRADGLHLEPRPPVADTTKKTPADSTKHPPAVPMPPAPKRP
jgi:hypothetical protein